MMQPRLKYFGWGRRSNQREASFQTLSTSYRVMSVNARLRASQTAACPNPRREANRRADALA